MKAHRDLLWIEQQTKPKGFRYALSTTLSGQSVTLSAIGDAQSWCIDHDGKEWRIERASLVASDVHPPEPYGGYPRRIITEKDELNPNGHLYLGLGPRILWRGLGSDMVVRWEDGPRIVSFGDAWRDKDLARGAVRIVHLEHTERAEHLLPLLISLPYLVPAYETPDLA